MNRTILLAAVIGVFLIVGGCQTYQAYTFLDPSSIPDQTYEVTVYEGPMARSYAVLFDIPDDGVEVLMEHTSFVEKAGLDFSGKYVDEFQTRVKGQRTLRISDREGTVRGYFMVSNLLNYRIQPFGERIMVSVEDPYYGYLRSTP